MVLKSAVAAKSMNVRISTAVSIPKHLDDSDLATQFHDPLTLRLLDPVSHLFLDLSPAVRSRVMTIRAMAGNDDANWHSDADGSRS